jgi:hypothetical protein
MGVSLHSLLAGGATLAAFALSSVADADVVISSGATTNVTCSSGICTPTSSSAVLNVGDLQTLLANGNVKLAAAGEPVDVDIQAPLSWVSTNTLTLDSYHSINVAQPIAITGGGGLALVTNDGGTGGQFTFSSASNIAIWSLSSSLTINGTAYTLVGDIATLASDVAANPGGSYALAGNYNAAVDGTYSASPINTNFTGNFQGLGNVISNLKISNNVQGSNVGLFAFATSTASVSNLVLQDMGIGGTGPSSIIGAVVAYNQGFVSGVHSSGTISGKARSVLGGVAGTNLGTLVNSSSSAKISVVSGSSIGDLVGQNNGTINNCFATGEISAANSKVTLGGLVGDDDAGNIANSYATGSVKAKSSWNVGGFVGDFQATLISTSYSTGAVKGGSSDDIGGFIGLFQTGTPSNDYWDTTTSHRKNATGNIKGKFPDITGLTTPQLQSGLPTGFDPTIWAQSPSINNGFPYLIANPPQ